MIRGRGAYGRKPDRGAILEAAQYGPVDIHHWDDSTGTAVIEQVQDVEAIVRENGRLWRDTDGYSPSRELRRVASIPLAAVNKLYAQGINIFDSNDWPRVCALLDSAEWQGFRTSAGTISRRPFREFVGARIRARRN